MAERIWMIPHNKIYPGAAYVAASLVVERVAVKVVDCAVEKPGERKLFALFQREKPDIVGFATNYGNLLNAYQGAKIAKEPGVRIVVKDDWYGILVKYHI